MKFSVIINNYNYGRYIAKAIISAQAQTLAPFEIIVIDDGSTDDSISQITALQSRLPNLRLHGQPNSGQLSAIRKGIELATGDWFFFLDADDMWMPDHLAEAARIINTHPGISFYYSDHRETTGPARFHTRWPEGTIGPIVSIVAIDFVRVGTITSTLGIRRDFARLALDFDPVLDPDWRTRADDCLIYGTWYAGAVGYYHPTPTVRYHIHGGNSFADTDYKSLKSLYNAKLTRLHKVLASRFAVHPESHVELLWMELTLTPRSRRHKEMKRLYRRAIRHCRGNRLLRLILLLRTLW